MLLNQFPTSRLRWALLSFVFFIIAGCIDWVPEMDSKPFPYLSHVKTLFASESSPERDQNLRGFLVFWGIHLAVPSIVLGWVAQGILGVATTIFRDRRAPVAPSA